MAQTLFGARVYNERNNSSNIRYDFLGKDSEVFAPFDVVTVSSGVLKVAGVTDVVAGVAVKTATMSADNDTVYPGYIPAEDTVFLMGTNADLTDNETNGGTFYKLTGTTGAMLVDVTSGVQTTTNRIVEIVKVDPQGLGGTGSGSGLRQCLVRFVKTLYNNVGGPA